MLKIRILIENLNRNFLSKTLTHEPQVLRHPIIQLISICRRFDTSIIAIHLQSNYTVTTSRLFIFQSTRLNSAGSTFLVVVVLFWYFFVPCYSFMFVSMPMFWLLNTHGNTFSSLTNTYTHSSSVQTVTHREVTNTITMAST